MADAIYLIDPSGRSVPMKPAPYSSEEEFQLLLSRYPELLAGEQIDRDNPREWLLVGREVGISEDEAQGARWSLDHLFVDQDGIPTLVEVKRQCDPRLRREVVGQLLDYAAHARFWTGAFLAQQFDKTCRQESRDPDQVLTSFASGKWSTPGALWGEVQKRIREGDMRLVFFADSVPNELQRVVEFLNEGMSTTEVLAVEVTRYTADSGYTTHVPRVFGRTSEAQAAKASARLPAKNWDETSFFEAVSTLEPSVQTGIRTVYQAAKGAGLGIRWGKGATSGSFNVVLPDPCGRAMLTVLTNGNLWLNMLWMYGSPQAERAHELLRAVAQQTGIPEQYMKQPAVGPDRWSPKLGEIVEAIRSIGSMSA